MGKMSSCWCRAFTGLSAWHLSQEKVDIYAFALIMSSSKTRKFWGQGVFSSLCVCVCVHPNLKSRTWKKSTRCLRFFMSAGKAPFYQMGKDHELVTCPKQTKVKESKISTEFIFEMCPQSFRCIKYSGSEGVFERQWAQAKEPLIGCAGCVFSQLDSIYSSKRQSACLSLSSYLNSFVEFCPDLPKSKGRIICHLLMIGRPTEADCHAQLRAIMKSAWAAS